MWHEQSSSPCKTSPGCSRILRKCLGMRSQVNILAFLTTTSGREGLTHLIADRSVRPKKRLRALGSPTPKPMCSNLNSRIRLGR